MIDFYQIQIDFYLFEFVIQDYYEIIKKPMDLSQIRKKLDTGQYNDPWEYVDDVWLMFDNAWLYNRKNSRVYKYCTKVLILLANDIIWCDNFVLW